MTPSPVDVTAAALGTRARVEHTGGGCEALVAPLEGGGHLVVCDNLSAPVWGDTDTAVAVFRRGAWQNGGEPIASAFGEDPLTPERLLDLIEAALAGVG